MQKIQIAIDVIEENLDLIEKLNGGIRPIIESEPAMFITYVVADQTEPSVIVFKKTFDTSMRFAKALISIAPIG